MNHDAKMWRTVGGDPAMAAPWYLMAGYAYEVLDAPIITDGAWDGLCRFVRDHREKVLQHRHGHLVDFDALTTGTASYITEALLPSLPKSAAQRLAGELRTPQKRKRK